MVRASHRHPSLKPNLQQLQGFQDACSGDYNRQRPKPNGSAVYERAIRAIFRRFDYSSGSVCVHPEIEKASRIWLIKGAAVKIIAI